MQRSPGSRAERSAAVARALLSFIDSNPADMTREDAQKVLLKAMLDQKLESTNHPGRTQTAKSLETTISTILNRHTLERRPGVKVSRHDLWTKGSRIVDPSFLRKIAYTIPSEYDSTTVPSLYLKHGRNLRSMKCSNPSNNPTCQRFCDRPGNWDSRTHSYACPSCQSVSWNELQGRKSCQSTKSIDTHENANSSLKVNGSNDAKSKWPRSEPRPSLIIIFKFLRKDIQLNFANFAENAQNARIVRSSSSLSSQATKSNSGLPVSVTVFPEQGPNQPVNRSDTPVIQAIPEPKRSLRSRTLHFHASLDPEEIAMQLDHIYNSVSNLFINLLDDTTSQDYRPPVFVTCAQANLSALYEKMDCLNVSLEHSALSALIALLGAFLQLELFENSTTWQSEGRGYYAEILREDYQEKGLHDEWLHLEKRLAWREANCKAFQKGNIRNRAEHLTTKFTDTIEPHLSLLCLPTGQFESKQVAWKDMLGVAFAKALILKCRTDAAEDNYKYLWYTAGTPYDRKYMMDAFPVGDVEHRQIASTIFPAIVYDPDPDNGKFGAIWTAKVLL